MIRISQIRSNRELDIEILKKKAARVLHLSPRQIKSLVVQKKSIDARGKDQIRYVYTVLISVDREEELVKRANSRDVCLAEETVYEAPIQPGNSGPGERGRHEEGKASGRQSAGEECRHEEGKASGSLMTRTGGCLGEGTAFDSPRTRTGGRFEEGAASDSFHDSGSGTPKGGFDHGPSPVIAGFGPAGMFCALLLARAGRKPIILERGSSVDKRVEDVEAFWSTGRLNPNSNVQFGEGGAGTFSDGKLNTLVRDPRGRNRFVLETFVKYGADPQILTDAKPHIGTDILRGIVKGIREEIISLGGEFHFDTRLKGFYLDKGGRLKGVLADHQGMDMEFPAKELILALGHSARDTFHMLYDKGVNLAAKPFAVGFRIQHPQEMINEA
ncbi:MAG: hypothetical protein K5989_00955, partial [Lachnospiraceae bacterium]|nr:hypothetical protein [Lachnospiraceae bacterium]